MVLTTFLWHFNLSLNIFWETCIWHSSAGSYPSAIVLWHKTSPLMSHSAASTKGHWALKDTSNQISRTHTFNLSPASKSPSPDSLLQHSGPWVLVSFPLSVTHWPFLELKSTFGCSGLILGASLDSESINYLTSLIILVLKNEPSSGPLKHHCQCNWCSYVEDSQVKYRFDWLSFLPSTPKLLRENLITASVEKMFVNSSRRVQIFLIVFSYQFKQNHSR